MNNDRDLLTLKDLYHIAVVGAKEGQSELLSGLCVSRIPLPSGFPAGWAAYKFARKPFVWWVMEQSQRSPWTLAHMAKVSQAIYRLELWMRIHIDMVMPFVPFDEEVSAEAMKVTLSWQSRHRTIVVVVYSSAEKQQSNWSGTKKLAAGRWITNSRIHYHYHPCILPLPLPLSPPLNFVFARGSGDTLAGHRQLACIVSEHCYLHKPLISPPTSRTRLPLTLEPSGLLRDVAIGAGITAAVLLVVVVATHRQWAVRV